MHVNCFLNLYDGVLAAKISSNPHTLYSANRGYVPVCISDFSLYLIWYEYNPYPTAFPYGNGMVLHFYQQQESSTTKTVYRVINRRLKAYI